MKKDVLYVSDLDGTLMRSDGTLSPETARMINALTARGTAFTYATARSIESARTIAGGLNLPLPAITRNGCVLADNATGIAAHTAVFAESATAALATESAHVERCFLTHGKAELKTRDLLYQHVLDIGGICDLNVVERDKTGDHWRIFQRLRRMGGSNHDRLELYRVAKGSLSR